MYHDHEGQRQIGMLEFDSSLENIRFYALPTAPGSGSHTEATMFTTRGMVYLIKAAYEPPQLSVYMWNNSSMDLIQTIQISHDLSTKIEYAYNSYNNNFMLSIPFIH